MCSIGIDLGTSESCVAEYRVKKGLKILENEHGYLTTPSYVAFTKTEILIGDEAKNQYTMNPDRTVFATKRFIGLRQTDSSVVMNKYQRPMMKLSLGNGKQNTKTPKEITVEILKKLKEITRPYINKSNTGTVISVPAHFNSEQRRAIEDAGKKAGLNVLELISEPAAVALEYKRKREIDRKTEDETKREHNVLIYDLGGGNFNSSVVTITENKIHIRASFGSSKFGGEDFVDRMVDHFILEFKKKHNDRKIEDSVYAVSRLRAACERAKRALSFSVEAYLELDCVFDGFDFYASITRACFEDLIHDYLQKTLEKVKQCLQFSQMRKGDIDDVVLVGGSTQIPKVRELLKTYGRNELKETINRDHAVACGAAIRAAMLEKILKLVEIEDKIPNIPTEESRTANSMERTNKTFPEKQIK